MNWPATLPDRYGFTENTRPSPFPFPNPPPDQFGWYHNHWRIISGAPPEPPPDNNVLVSVEPNPLHAFQHSNAFVTFAASVAAWAPTESIGLQVWRPNGASAVLFTHGDPRLEWQGQFRAWIRQVTPIAQWGQGFYSLNAVVMPDQETVSNSLSWQVIFA